MYSQAQEMRRAWAKKIHYVIDSLGFEAKEIFFQFLRVRHILPTT